MLERHRNRTPGWGRALMSDSGCLASVVAGVLVGVGVTILTGWQGWLGWIAPVLVGGVRQSMLIDAGRPSRTFRSIRRIHRPGSFLRILRILRRTSFFQAH